MNTKQRYEKIDEIIERSKDIKPELVAKEVMDWLINNVENYIDNSIKSFKIDLVIDSKEGMQEIQKLQALYREVPDSDIEVDNRMPKKEREEINKLVEKCQKSRRMLDEITNEAFKIMQGSNEAIATLFGRMIFFYERVIQNPDNRKKALKIDEDLKDLFNQKDKIKDVKAIKKLQEKIVAKIKEGEQLIKFEQFDGTVDITSFAYDAFEVGVKLMEGETPENEDREKEIMKEYVVPEGFSIWIELISKPKLRPTAIF